MARTRNKNRDYDKERTSQPNNAQDLAEDKQYEKGERAGEDKSRRKNARGGKFIVTTKSTNMDAANPIEHHSINADILKAMGTLMPHMITGLPIERFDNYGNAAAIHTPGIMTLGYLPTIGDANDDSDGINVAMTQLFSFMRSKTSGQNYFEAPDIALYITSTSSLYTLFALGCRIYGTMDAWDVQNRYVPDELLRAAGFDPKSFRRNKLNFWGWLNDFAMRIASRVMPVDIMYFTRQMWMVSNYYRDSATRESQLIQFVPTSLFQLNEGISAAKTKYYISKQVSNPKFTMPGQTSVSLVAVPWASDGTTINGSGDNARALCTVEQFMEFADALWANQNRSQDMGYISAAIERAFEASIMNVQKVSEDYQVTPVYEETVLRQVENIHILTNVSGFRYVLKENISINAGWIELENVFAVTSPYVAIFDAYKSILTQDEYNVMVQENVIKAQADEILLNFHGTAADVTPEAVMEASRMCAARLDPEVDKNAITTDNWVGIPYDPNIQSVHSLQTHSTEVFVCANINQFEFKNPYTPWTGVSTHSYAFGSYYYTVDYAQRMRAAIARNATDEAKLTLFTAFVNYLTIQREENERMLTLLSKWDWHPIVNEIKYAYTSGNTVALFTLLSQPFFDIDIPAIMEVRQLRQLNAFDVLSQFTCRQLHMFM